MRLREVSSRDGKSDIPVGYPLVAWQTELTVLLLEHLSTAIVENNACIVALERVEDALVVRVSSNLVDNIVEVVRLLAIAQLFLEELAKGLLDNGVHRVDVHFCLCREID